MRSITPLLILLLIACSPVLPIENPFPRTPLERNEGLASPSPPLQIIVLDVGQGDATLIIGPSGRTLLIDGGPPETGPPAIRSLFETDGLEAVDWVVASHFDLDHMGGLPSILATEPVNLAVIDRGDSTEKHHPLFEEYLRLSGDLRKTAYPGQTFSLGQGATATVIVVNGQFSDGRSIHLNPDEENESSIGLLVQYGDFEYFTAGDLTGGGSPGGFPSKNLEEFAGEIIGDIDVLHASHHGSATSSQESYLELIRPEVAIISVGEGNTYKHPSEEVLGRLEKRDVTVWRTDLHGTLTILSDGENYEVDSSVPFP